MINVAKAIAGNTDLSSAQVFIYRNDIYSIAAIISASHEDIFLKIKQTMSELEEPFNTEAQNLQERFNLLHQSINEKMADVQSLQVMLCAWSEDILYIQSRGHYYASLFRNEQQINLITPEQHDQFISGHILPGDKVLLGTQSMNELLGDIDSRNTDLAFLIKDPIDDFQDQLNVLVVNKTDLSPTAALLLEVEKPEPVQTGIPRPAVPKRRIHLPIPKLPNFSWLRRRFPKIELALAIFVVLLIVTGIFFGLRHFRVFQRSNPANNLVTESRAKLATSLGLKDSNPADAKANLEQAIALANQAQKADPESSDLKSLQNDIDNAKVSILKIAEIRDWPVYLNLDLIKSGFTTKRLSDSINNFLMLDETSKTLVMLDVTQKSNQILAGSRQLGSASHASINGDFAYTFSPDKGVIQIDTSNQKDTVIVKVDPQWGLISDIYAFGTNVYLLDTAKNQIWKYVPTPTGYSEKSAYLKSDQVNIRDGTRMQIDSSIWVLVNHSNIERFTSGDPDFFSVSGMEEPIKEISSFYVADNTDNLYLIDPSNSRMVILNKKGEYQSQYVGDKFKTADDLVVDEKARKIYLLEGGKIYQLELR